MSDCIGEGCTHESHRGGKLEQVAPADDFYAKTPARGLDKPSLPGRRVRHAPRNAHAHRIARRKQQKASRRGNR